MIDSRDSEKSRDRFPALSDGLHGSLIPADIRKDDRIAAKIRLGDDYVTCRVWRLSPFGVEILGVDSKELVKGTKVEVELTIEGKSSGFDGIIVDLIGPYDNHDQTLVGIRFVNSDSRSQTSSETDRRKSKRWMCSENFFPTCVTPTPGRINDYIYFRIHDISAEGMLMKCSLRNKHLLPEMKLEMFAQFPGSESTQIDVSIKRIRIEEQAGRDVLEVGVKFEHLSRQAKQSIGQYLMQFSTDTSPEEIRQAGFKIQSVAMGTEFYFLKTEADYQKVLELRKIVHIRDGNIKEDTTAEEMGDLNDSRSRIIVGKIDGKVVATARLRYNESDAPLEHEAHMDWPTDFPRRDQIVEISRAATHPAYRQGDLFVALWRYMATYALQKQRPYVLIGSTTPLIKFYEKSGFRLTGHTHGEDLWTIPQHLMLCNLHKTVMGKNTHPLYWNQLYEPIAGRAIAAGILAPNELERIRMSAFRKLGWLAKLVFRKPRRSK